MSHNIISFQTSINQGLDGLKVQYCFFQDIFLLLWWKINEYFVIFLYIHQTKSWLNAVMCSGVKTWVFLFTSFDFFCTPVLCIHDFAKNSQKSFGSLNLSVPYKKTEKRIKTAFTKDALLKKKWVQIHFESAISNTLWFSIWEGFQKRQGSWIPWTIYSVKPQSGSTTL